MADNWQQHILTIKRLNTFRISQIIHNRPKKTKTIEHDIDAKLPGINAV